MAKYTVDDIINALGQKVSVSVLKKMIRGMKKGSRVYAKILFLQHRNLECRECRQCRECGEAFRRRILNTHHFGITGALYKVGYGKVWALEAAMAAYVRPPFLDEVKTAWQEKQQAKRTDP